MATLVRAIFDQPAAGEGAAQHARVVASLGARRPDAAEHLDQARGDLLAFVGQLWQRPARAAERELTA